MLLLNGINIFPGLAAEIIVRNRIMGCDNFPSWTPSDGIAKDFIICPL